MLNRRHFLAGLTALAAAGQAAARPVPQPYTTLGVQLYTVRDALAADPAGTLQKVYDIGYRRVETVSFGGMTAKDFKGLLDRIGLAAPSCHIGLGDWQTRAEAALDDAVAIGADYAVVPWLPDDQRKDWEKLAAQMNAWADLAADRDLSLAYHNHNFEFTPAADGRIPYHILLDNTDPAKVYFELDCYWASLAGHDPAHILEEHGPRVRLLHLKDKTATGDMAPVGEGVIDFPTVLSKAKTLGIDYVYVEHDNPADPFASITTSYQNLRG